MARPSWIAPPAWRALLRGGTAIAAIARARAELLTATALLAGWLLVTHGLVQLTTAKVWPISIGALLLSLCGWRFLFILFRDGLYRLTREPRSERRG